MFPELYSFLKSQPVFTLFLVISLGYLVGRIRVGGISTGAVGGVLLIGLVFGHFGFSVSPAVQSFGFALFIFCVGYQAGPRFITVLKTNGLKFLSLAIVVVATGLGLSIVLARLLDLEPGMAAGLLGGAMTTTPTLAAAQDAVRSGIASIPEGFTQDRILTNIGASYALTYLFGLIGLILAVRLMPAILKVDLSEEAAKMNSGNDPESGPDTSRISRRVYEVAAPDSRGRTILDLQREVYRDISVAAVRRNGRLLDLNDTVSFEAGDIVMVIGRIESILEKANRLGGEVPNDPFWDIPLETLDVVVSESDVVGVPIKDIYLEERIGALPVSVRRLQVELPLQEDLVLHRGDVVTFYGPSDATDRLVRSIGHVENDVDKTDLFTFALGIAAGIGLGTLALTIKGVTITLGMAGGLLITGLVIGYLRSIRPIFGRVPAASRWILMEMGLLMFMAGVGVSSGSGIVEVIRSSGISLIGAGALVTLLPLFIGYLFGVKILGLNPLEALGGVTGSMTSGAALKVVTDAAGTNAPALAYTGAYAFANVLLTLAGTLIML